MTENKMSDYVLVIMKNLNLIIILYISLIMACGLSGYVQDNSALSFLTRIDSIPITAWKIPVIALCLYVVCLLLMHIQSVNSFALGLIVCLEIAIGFLISYILGFSYTGMILLILADAIKYFHEARWKFSFAVVLCIIYLVINFDLLSVHIEIIPLEAYLGYFESSVQSVMLGIKNIIGSLNTFVFLVYMILAVHIQMSEKERILELNEQLNIANDELQKANIQLEEYAKESEQMVQTRERNRLAREIHDTLGHALTGIITGIEACATLMDVAPEATKIQLKAISDIARQGITDVRRSVNALRPDALEKLDLGNALRQTIEEMHTATNAEIDYECTTSLEGFNQDEEDIIYRIVQESITNAIRHGKADHIWINISRENNMLKIYIRDNGIGSVKINKGFGLHHMEERLNMLKGKLAYNGENGFIVEAQIPIRWGVEEKKDD